MRLSTRHCAALLCVAVFVSSVGPARAAAGDDVGFFGWGPRVGVSHVPDQVFVGAHFDLGHVAKNLRMQPNIEIGWGSNQIRITPEFALHYQIQRDWGGWKPYAGGEVGLSHRRWTSGKDDGEKTDRFAINAVFGIERGIGRAGDKLAFEAKAGLVTQPDLKVLVAWTF